MPSRSSWFIHVFEVSDADSQRAVVKALKRTDGVTVERRRNGSSRFVLADCCTRTRAEAMVQAVLSIDPGATLVHKNEGPDPFSRWLVERA